MIILNMDIDEFENKLWKFRLNACIRQSDGCDRGLWYDKKNEKLFETCESGYPIYTFDNPNDIVLLIMVHGDNNANGLDEVCEGCSDICTCEKGDILYEICFTEICKEWYPLNPINYGSGEKEKIKLVPYEVKEYGKNSIFNK